ncbi:MAG TPA: ABC transporter permease, partial [Abditibacterium sp.]
SDGGVKGQNLFWTLVYGQVFLVLMLIPALSTGALAQERERQTLEPLLLTPLSPLQIVWGKAGGVLSLVGLLLLASLPLTSLCFLLGGVSPGMLVAAYAGILGLAIFTTGFGLYCAARWPGAARSMGACYALLPVALSLVLVFLPLGSLFSGLCVLVMLFYGILKGLKRGETSDFARKIGPLYGRLMFVLAPLLIVGLLVTMAYDRNIGLIVVGVGFVLSYFVMAAQWGFLQTARELMLRNDPEAPLRQKVADFKSDWQAALTAPPVPTGYTPAPQTQSEWATLAASQAATEPSQIKRNAAKDADSYGRAPFLSDKLNPIFAREMRSGLLGKWEYLFRLSYGLTIVSELALLAFLLLSISEPTYLSMRFEPIFAKWGSWHLFLVMGCGAWFGARAIAPEREGQTLSQLFTIPMPAQKIIGGKLAAVMLFTFYVQVLAIPLALLLAMTGLAPWSMALQFIVVETILGALAAAWGTYCSFHCGNVRSALSWSLGGVAVLLLSSFFVEPLWEILRLLGFDGAIATLRAISGVLPLPLLFPSAISSEWALLAMVIYALSALLFVFKTARDFGKLARET